MRARNELTLAYAFVWFVMCDRQSCIAFKMHVKMCKYAYCRNECCISILLCSPFAEAIKALNMRVSCVHLHNKNYFSATNYHTTQHTRTRIINSLKLILLYARAHSKWMQFCGGGFFFIFVYTFSLFLSFFNCSHYIQDAHLTHLRRSFTACRSATFIWSAPVSLCFWMQFSYKMELNV